MVVKAFFPYSCPVSTVSNLQAAISQNNLTSQHNYFWVIWSAYGSNAYTIFVYTNTKRYPIPNSKSYPTYSIDFAISDMVPTYADKPMFLCHNWFTYHNILASSLITFFGPFPPPFHSIFPSPIPPSPTQKNIYLFSPHTHYNWVTFHHSPVGPHA